MNNERYPQGLAISLQDFQESGWKEVVDQALSESYPMLWQSFSEAARTAIEQGKLKTGKVLWILSDACSLVLSPLSANESFKPFAVFHDKRSINLDELLETNVAFFAEILDAIDQDWLRARISDLLWLGYSPRKPEFALIAIDAYRSIPIDEQTWARDGEHCWQRAISLAQMLGKTAKDKLQNIEDVIFSRLNAATSSDGFLAIWLANLMKSNRLGKAHRLEVARKLEIIAQEFKNEGNLYHARHYFDAASAWYKLISDGVKAAEMTASVAEIWVTEASARSSTENPTYMVSANCYRKAINIYRDIPTAFRSKHVTEERIAELITLQIEAGKGAMEQMQPIQTDSIDLTEYAEEASQYVTGRATKQALLVFSNLYCGARVDELREAAIQILRSNPMSAAIPKAKLSDDGRIVKKTPGFSLGPAETTEDELAILSNMIDQYRLQIICEVQGRILPALDVLLREHRIRESDFIMLAKDSNFVPLDRVNLFGKALFAGYDGDFITAIHLLIPQIENLVRAHLKQAGALTTYHDRSGVVTENGLSTLMELPEAVTVFGKDICFELKTLLCDANGLNLRNELAHGLLSENKCNSLEIIYVWWLALKLTVNTWWSRANIKYKQYEEAEVNIELTTTSEPIAEDEP